MRHSEAVESLQDLGIQKDFDRPLTDNGIALLDQSRHFFKEIQFCPDKIVCSASVRTKQTLEWVRDSLGNHAEVVYEEALYKANTDQIIELISKLEPSVNQVLIVGHNPWISELIQLLLNVTSDPTAVALPAPPALSAIFTVHIDDWSTFNIGSNSVELKALKSPLLEAGY